MVSTRFFLRWLASVTGVVLLSTLLMAQRADAGPYSALVVEVESERVLFSQHADELRHPASLTKMMTLYLVFEALSEGKLALSDTMVASPYAVSRPPSRIGLRAGESLTVEEAILALVTQSANDAATTIAESLGGSEAAFAGMMTAKAHQLGMYSTVFHNASGLPDREQVTTAWDMFRLGKALLKRFPRYYSYFSTDHFDFRDRSFRNHNHLLKTYPGTDGIKTGFINASGFNLVASAKRGGNRLIGVVFGGSTHGRRDAHMRDILDDGFDRLEGREPVQRYAMSQPADVPTLLKRPPPLYSTGEKVMRLAGGSKLKVRREVGDSGGDIADGPRSSAWQVQIGQFSAENQAQQRLHQARKVAPYALRHAKAAVAKHSRRGKKSYVAYYAALTKAEAALACKELGRKHIQCAASPAAR